MKMMDTRKFLEIVNKIETLNLWSQDSYEMNGCLHRTPGPKHLFSRL